MALTAETIERAPEQMIKERVEIKTTILSDSMEKCQTMHTGVKNEGLSCFQALKRVVGEITPTLGLGWGRKNRNFLA
jgi:hypothetical protein